jgi:hypothetical protein
MMPLPKHSRHRWTIQAEYDKAELIGSHGQTGFTTDRQGNTERSSYSVTPNPWKRNGLQLKKTPAGASTAITID